MEKIIFIHIPKTGGTSVRDFFISAYGRSQIAWLGPDFRREDLLIHNNPFFDKYKVVGGHFSFRDSKNIRGEKVYITTVRNPVERTISLFRYIQRTKDHDLHDLAVRKRLDEMFIESDVFKNQVSNLLIKYLSCVSCVAQRDACVELALNTLLSEKFYISNVRNVSSLLDRIGQDLGIEKKIPVSYLNVNPMSGGTTKDVLHSDLNICNLISNNNLYDVKLIKKLEEMYDESGVLAPEKVETLA